VLEYPSSKSLSGTFSVHLKFINVIQTVHYSLERVMLTESAPKVAAVIINYDGKKWLKRCLGSVAKTRYPNLSVFLVDNASKDGSIDYVRESFPWAKIIRHDQNCGFAEGYNRAIKQVEADYVALLNNDTEILEPNWIEMLVRLAENDSSIAAIACKMVFSANTLVINSAGSVGIPYWRGAVDIGYEELDAGQFDNPPIEPFGFCGGAALIRLDRFRKAQGFDESYFAFFEDTDLSWRFRIMGYRIAYVPTAKVAHYSSGTWSDEAKKTYLCKRNLFRSILKNCSGEVVRWALPSYILFTLLASMTYLLVERAPLMSLALIKSILWNITHLRNTYRKRILTQRARRIGDIEILAAMYPPLLVPKIRTESFRTRLSDTIFGSLPKDWLKRISAHQMERLSNN
jgi:GT2 family glycosyltransferase